MSQIATESSMPQFCSTLRPMETSCRRELQKAACQNSAALCDQWKHHVAESYRKQHATILQHSATNGNIMSQRATESSMPKFCSTLRPMETSCRRELQKAACHNSAALCDQWKRHVADSYRKQHATILQHSATNGNIMSQIATESSMPQFCSTLRHFATLCDLVKTRLYGWQRVIHFSSNQLSYKASSKSVYFYGHFYFIFVVEILLVSMSNLIFVLFCIFCLIFDRKFLISCW